MGLFARIGAWVTAAFSRTPLIEPIELVQQPSLYYQHTRIGGSLTPEDVSNILRTADTGYMWRLQDLANESRQKDAHLQSILGTRELTVAGMRHHVIPVSESAQDQKIADWCRDWLANFGTWAPSGLVDEPRDLRHLVTHLAGANYHGYAVSETLYQKDGGYLCPCAAVPVAPRRFVFDIETGRFMFWDVQGSIPYPGTDLMAAYPGRFINFHPRVNGDYDSREGLARLLVWIALFRNWALSDWLKLAEIAWKPMRHGSYVSGRGKDKTLTPAAKEDKAVLRAALESLVTNGVALYPDTVDINVEWPNRGTGAAQHENLCRFLAQDMSKAVLGQTLTSEQGRVGSQALGEVHNDVRLDLRDADAHAIAAILRRDLLGPAVRMNFGPDAAVPLLVFVADRTVDLVQLSAAVKNFTDAGLPIPAAWARDIAKIPHPKPGDELVGGGVYQLPDPKAPPAGPKRPGSKGARILERWRRRTYSIPERIAA